jgi:hypothetical protein
LKNPTVFNFAFVATEIEGKMSLKVFGGFAGCDFS